MRYAHLLLTKEQMEKLTTVRLLKYFKSHRSYSRCFDSCDCDRCLGLTEDHKRMDEAREILNSREHVERK